MNLNGRSCRVRVPNKITKYLHAFETMNITRSLEILYLISCEQNNAQTNNIFMCVLSCTYICICIPWRWEGRGMPKTKIKFVYFPYFFTRSISERKLFSGVGAHSKFCLSVCIRLTKLLTTSVMYRNAAGNKNKNQFLSFAQNFLWVKAARIILLQKAIYQKVIYHVNVDLVG